MWHVNKSLWERFLFHWAVLYKWPSCRYVDMCCSGPGLQSYPVTGEKRILVCTGHLCRQWRWLRYSKLRPATWLTTLCLGKAQVGNDKPQNHKSVISSVQVFHRSFSLTNEEINTTLLASLTVKITGISFIASRCLPGEEHSGNGSLLDWFHLYRPCTHLLANEVSKDARITKD